MLFEPARRPCDAPPPGARVRKAAVTAVLIGAVSRCNPEVAIPSVPVREKGAATVMTSTLQATVSKGWKVYLGSTEVGEVEEVSEHELAVKRGTLVKHVYYVPLDTVVEASDGIVDIRDEGRTRELLDID